MENPIKVDDLGVPLFSETLIYIYGYPFTNTPWVPRTLLQHAPFAVVRDDPGGVNMIWRPGTLKGFRGKWVYLQYLFPFI